MKKPILFCALALVTLSFSASMSSAKDKVYCTTTAVEGDKVTATCQEAYQVAPGEKVQISIKYDNEKLYCEVTAVEGEKVTLTCADAAWLEPDDYISIKPIK